MAASSCRRQFATPEFSGNDWGLIASLPFGIGLSALLILLQMLWVLLTQRLQIRPASRAWATPVLSVLAGGIVWVLTAAACVPTARLKGQIGALADLAAPEFKVAGFNSFLAVRWYARFSLPPGRRGKTCPGKRPDQYHGGQLVGQSPAGQSFRYDCLRGRGGSLMDRRSGLAAGFRQTHPGNPKHYLELARRRCHGIQLLLHLGLPELSHPVPGSMGKAGRAPSNHYRATASSTAVPVAVRRLGRLIFPTGDPTFDGEPQVVRRAEEMQVIGNQQVIADEPHGGRVFPDAVQDTLHGVLRQPALPPERADGEENPVRSARGSATTATSAR